MISGMKKNNTIPVFLVIQRTIAIIMSLSSAVCFMLSLDLTANVVLCISGLSCYVCLALNMLQSEKERYKYKSYRSITNFFWIFPTLFYCIEMNMPLIIFIIMTILIIFLLYEIIMIKIFSGAKLANGDNKGIEG